MTWQIVIIVGFVFVTIWLGIHNGTKRHIADKQVEIAKIPRGFFGNPILPEPRSRVLDDDDS